MQGSRVKLLMMGKRPTEPCNVGVNQTILQLLGPLQQLFLGRAASANLDLGNMQLKVQIWSHVTILLLFRVHNCPADIHLQVQERLAVRQELLRLQVVHLTQEWRQQQLLLFFPCLEYATTCSAFSLAPSR